MSLLTIFFFMAFGLCLIILIFAGLPSSKERAIQDRITSIRNPRRIIRYEGGEAALAAAESARLSDRLGRYLKGYPFSGLMSGKIELLLLQADSSDTLGMVILKSVRCLAVGLALGGLLLRSIPAAVVVGAVLTAFPVARLRAKRLKRLKAATRGLPDAADLMARAMRTGHSVTQAIEALAEQAPPPLAAEFGRVFQEQKLGVPLREVLIDLSRRVPSRDLHFLVTAILVQRETGGDLAEILDRTTETLRERIRVEGEVRVQTAQGRLTGWILSALPLAILAFISFFCPGYAGVLFADPLGRKLLYAAAASMLTGALVIRSMVKVTF